MSVVAWQTKYKVTREQMSTKRNNVITQEPVNMLPK